MLHCFSFALICLHKTIFLEWTNISIKCLDTANNQSYSSWWPPSSYTGAQCCMILLLACLLCLIPYFSHPSFSLNISSSSFLKKDKKNTLGMSFLFCFVSRFSCFKYVFSLSSPLTNFFSGKRIMDSKELFLWILTSLFYCFLVFSAVVGRKV